MKAFTEHEGLVAILDRANIDTDQIIPKQFLKKIERSGFGKHLFHDWRFLDNAGTKPNPDFSLNQERYLGATVLLTRDNFGCGSSREHAPWALEDYGFRVIIAPSYADIFYNNCFKNGMLPIVMDSKTVDDLFKEVESKLGAKIRVDLQSQKLFSPSGKVYSFDLDPFRKECLYKGLDDIGLTMIHEKKIDEYEEKQKKSQPWLYEKISN
ncbi:MAG: 3-isopropylmalate dehydratase small subunit [Leptospiraceae bacterium]|nr:3-isopropylmalate dehydratase small subunit [Leptospiraceae bacterium]MCK6381176.1 3-isopropylmalate dehydratase small subunit [Leptospiraceae bacterium]NUM40864.1 3-isopropylmalate dehydratase small subunit [Leptospiraceae bacterium]